MSEADLDMLELRIVQLANEAEAEKRKHAERLRVLKTRISALQSYLEGATVQAQSIYELVNNAIEEADG